MALGQNQKLGNKKTWNKFSAISNFSEFSICLFFIFQKFFFSILKYRKSHSQNGHRRCCIKKAVLKNFAIFRGKHLCWSLYFNKVSGLRPATSLKKRLRHRCFPANIAKFLRTAFFIDRTSPVVTSKSRQLRTLHLCHVLFLKPFKVFFSFSNNI